MEALVAVAGFSMGTSESRSPRKFVDWGSSISVGLLNALIVGLFGSDLSLL